jgi:hypothetical protein
MIMVIAPLPGVQVRQSALWLCGILSSHIRVSMMFQDARRRFKVERQKRETLASELSAHAEISRKLAA